MVDNIEIQGDNVVVTNQVVINKAEYLARQEERLVQLVEKREVAQNQLDSIVAAINDLQILINSLK